MQAVFITGRLKSNKTQLNIWTDHNCSLILLIRLQCWENIYTLLPLNTCGSLVDWLNKTAVRK